MSTAAKRPRLNFSELHQLRWLLGGLLTLTAVGATCYLDMTAWPLLAMISLVVVAGLIRPGLPALLPRWVDRLAFPLILSAFVFDLYAHGEILPALVRLALALVLYRSCTYRKRRDDLQLILLGLFLVVTAGVLTVAIGFALQIALFAGLALGLLFTRTLLETRGEEEDLPRTPGSNAPAWTEFKWNRLMRKILSASDWRVWVFCGVLFAGLVGLSGVLFVSIPRFQLENGLFLDRWATRRSVTGFSDNLRFGEVSDIQKDDGVALRVEVSDPAAIPRSLYWRMTVLDEYRDQSFHLSARSRQELFSREFMTSNIASFGFPAAAKTAEWTFYLEPGVSRYLPLLGPFSRRVFTEPQKLRRSDRLRILELGQDPATMKAYRISGMDTSGVLREHLSPRSAAQLQRRQAALQLNFSAEDRADWARIAREAAGGEPLSAEEFARRTMAWLHQHHRYALQSTIPAGPGDALLRWTRSSQPGHCELFAGAFTMIARSAGWPTRVVAGFLGATWNGDYLLVRNSNAHAWCEMDDGRGEWRRMDPTADPEEGSVQTQPIEQSALLAKPAGDWSERFDRLRMLWYRHIVNFERRDQQQIVESLKENTEKSRQGFRDLFDRGLIGLRQWLQRPWGWRRLLSIAGSTIVGGLMIFAWWNFGRSWWTLRTGRKGPRVDPVRQRAGGWLRRFASLAKKRGEVVPEFLEVKSALERMRYGSRESWPDASATFRQARRVFKTAARGRQRIGRKPD